MQCKRSITKARSHLAPGQGIHLATVMGALLFLGAALSPGCAAGAGPTALCGDGVVDPGEECDDGNLQGGDGCSATCTVEPGFGCTGEPSLCSPLCGNGRLDPGELCDDGGESFRCNDDCTAAVCGDGKLNIAAGEECDDGGESATCNDDCTTAVCGDGKLNVSAGEGCDDGGESATCNDDCTTAVCGDGKLNVSAGEDCDDGGESASCNDDCTTAVCGDGKLNASAGEECDDGNTAPGDGCDEDCKLEIVACDSPFTSTYGGDNGWEGNMFDIVAQRPLTVTHFDGHFHTGTQDLQIFYRLGTHVGFEANSSAWTFIGGATVQGAGAGNVTPIPITVNIAVTTGQRVAFYVTTQGKSLGSGNVYTNGVGTGTLYASNSDLHFYEGVGNYSNFGGTFSNRVFNGTIYYSCH